MSNTAALLGLWSWSGQLIGVVVWTVRHAVVALRVRLPNRHARHGLLAALVGALTLILARKLFAGDGIGRTAAATFVPWFVAASAVLGAGFAARLGSGGRAQRARWLIATAAAAMSVGALVLDNRAPGGYLYLHVLLLVLGLALAALSQQLIRLPRFVAYTALAVSLLTLPSLVAFPASRSARELMARPTWAGLQLVEYVQFHVDFDHDGQSPAFGGGDCNDADSSVFIGAPERPGDGRDSDCDGLDDPKAFALPLRPFQVTTERADQIGEHAKQFPTVVILIDALRFDRIGDARFPHLAQLARESTRFTHVYATSATTLSSVPAMMTGSVRPARERDNILQSLAHAGQTSVFVGPDVVTEHFQKLGPHNPLLGYSSCKAIATDHASAWGTGGTAPTGEQITATATELLGSAHPPDLLWLHYFDVHQWNVLDESGLPPRGDYARYDAVLERLDASLGPLLAMRDRLSVVLLADHGEGLGARGLTYHANFEFQELAHIPVLIRVPGSAPATVDVPVTGTSVFNTLRTLRGLATDTTADPGLLTLVGATNVGEGPGFPGFESAQWSFLHGNYRLLYVPQQQLVELYDVARDPREQVNLLDAEPQVASQMLARLFQLHNEQRQ